jgi:hypothetical protein
MTRSAFEALVREAMRAIPRHFRDRMQNVEIVVEDAPSADLLAEMGYEPGETLFGLYQGTPLTERGWAHGNALPDRIRRKYYVVANETGKDGPDGEARFYADERGEYLAFKVTENRLVTRLAAAEVIRDMVSVAQHRQWEALHVRGSVEFRREAWLEAGARGLEVQGYQPTELDRQALADRREVWDRAHSGTPEVEARSASDRGERADWFDYDKGISGRLIEVGQAPYRNRSDAEASTYVALELDNGRQHQVWGVGLEKATADSNAKLGDRDVAVAAPRAEAIQPSARFGVHAVGDFGRFCQNTAHVHLASHEARSLPTTART